MKVRCVENGCSAELSGVDLQRLGIKQHLIERLSYGQLQGCLQEDPAFRWCTRSGCGSGQIHEGGSSFPIMTCCKCDFKVP